MESTRLAKFSTTPEIFRSDNDGTRLFNPQNNVTDEKISLWYFSMWTNILIILSTVVIPVVVSEDVPKQTTLRTNYLRNFYNNREDHERHADYFMQMRQIETETTGSLHSQRSTHKIRHRAERKISKVKRCRRYAQLYYQNYIGTNCYYAVCRQSYCGYCPTSSCRRRCPYNCVTKGNDQNAVTSNPMDYSTTQLSKGFLFCCYFNNILSVLLLFYLLYHFIQNLHGIKGNF